MMRTWITRPLNWACATTLTLAGCLQADFGELRVEQRSNAPLPIEVDERQVIIPIGIAVTLKVKPVSANRQKYTSNDDLEFASDNPSVMQAFQIEETSEVVVTGVRLGSTCLRVIVNDEDVACLDVRVREQPVEPERDR
jgi:hypothetical protein